MNVNNNILCKMSMILLQQLFLFEQKYVSFFSIIAWNNGPLIAIGTLYSITNEAKIISALITLFFDVHSFKNFRTEKFSILSLALSLCFLFKDCRLQWSQLTVKI